jgi:outer membrane immunogenic protein
MVTYKRTSKLTGEYQMKIASTIFGLATATVLSTAALAADLPSRVVKPGIAPAASCFWAGPYLGAQVGYTWNTVKTNYLDIGGAPANSSHNKVTGGVYAGYNFCLTPGLIGGIELDVTKFGNAPKHDTRNGAGTLFNFNHHDTNFGGSAVFRLGLPVNRALFYVKGGVGVAQQKAYSYNANLLGPVAGVSASKTSFGYVVGAGVDYAFTNNWVGRLGYTYFDGGKISALGGRWNSKYHTVNLGVAYKF